MIGDLNDIGTAIQYSKHLEERPDDYVKPIVYFTGNAVFDTDMFEGHEVAHVRTVNHPAWGSQRVRTSSIVKRNSDGSFETLNTQYRPYVDMEGS
jgi:hypothetical protein